MVNPQVYHGFLVGFYHVFCGVCHGCTMASHWFTFFLWFTISLLGFTIVKLYLQWFYCYFLHPLVGFAIVLLWCSNLWLEFGFTIVLAEIDNGSTRCTIVLHRVSMALLGFTIFWNRCYHGFAEIYHGFTISLAKPL